MHCLERQTFDEHAFGVPFYRVSSDNWDAISDEIAQLENKGGPFIVDAKRDAHNLEANYRLGAMGFRKVCMQIKMLNQLTAVGMMDPAVSFTASVDWPESVIDAHVSNFNCDRFSLDPLLPRKGHDRLYRSWIKNTLTSDRAFVLHIDYNFLTFKQDNRSATIDLLSVLDRGQGIGQRLLTSFVALANSRHLSDVKTVTECENRAAVNIYRKSGFEFSVFQAAYHFVAL